MQATSKMAHALALPASSIPGQFVCVLRDSEYTNNAYWLYLARKTTRVIQNEGEGPQSWLSSQIPSRNPNLSVPLAMSNVPSCQSRGYLKAQEGHNIKVTAPL